MTAQDGLQASGLAVATSTGLAVLYGIAASYFSVTASSTNTAAAFFDMTGGASVVASSTGASYPLAAGEVFPKVGFGAQKYNATYSGFSAKTSDSSATLRWIAWR